MFRRHHTFNGFGYLKTSFSTTILSRFFVNLREAGAMIGTGTLTTQSLSDMQFSRGVGSLDGPLLHSPATTVSMSLMTQISRRMETMPHRSTEISKDQYSVAQG
ncbi:hypothetical protein DAEQUDRAFT_720797, partial [Daedalea quercina L-15889]